MSTSHCKDPIGWLIHKEHYFTVSMILESEKVGTTSVCVLGKTPNWFQQLDVHSPTQGQTQFKTELYKRFHLSKHKNVTYIIFFLLTKNNYSIIHYYTI